MAGDTGQATLTWWSLSLIRHTIHVIQDIKLYTAGDTGQATVTWWSVSLIGHTIHAMQDIKLFIAGDTGQSRFSLVVCITNSTHNTCNTRHKTVYSR